MLSCLGTSDLSTRLRRLPRPVGTRNSTQSVTPDPYLFEGDFPLDLCILLVVSCYGSGTWFLPVSRLVSLPSGSTWTGGSRDRTGRERVLPPTRSRCRPSSVSRLFVLSVPKYTTFGFFSQTNRDHDRPYLCVRFFQLWELTVIETII